MDPGSLGTHLYREKMVQDEPRDTVGRSLCVGWLNSLIALFSSAYPTRMKMPSDLDA